MLTDDQNGVYGQPTRKNILDALSWIGETAGRSRRDRDGRIVQEQEQEKVVIYYSGHGKVAASHTKSNSKKGASRHSDTPRRSPNDATGNDTTTGTGRGEESNLETIYPVDFRSFPRGMITPEEMEEKLLPAKRRGVRMTVIFDACAAVS